MSLRLVTLITQIMVMAVVISAVLLVLGIGIFISIHLCIVGRALSRSLNSRRATQRGVSSSSSSVSGKSEGMSQEEVQKLPSFEYKHGGMFIVLDRMSCKGDNNRARNINCMNRIENGLWVDEFDCSECAVCLDGFQSGEKCRLLPVCRHAFHLKCVDSWLYKNPLCPICRTRAQQHGEERGTVVLENVLELAQVGHCEMGNGTSDIAIGVAVQGGVGGERGSGFHQSEMSNLVSNPPLSPTYPPTDEFVCNLMSTASLPSPLQYRPNDDDGGSGARVIDVLSLSQSQSHNSQNQNQSPCKLISTQIPSCRADDDDSTRAISVLSPIHQSQSQNQNQNSCNSMSIPMPSCRPPDEDGVMVSSILIASQSQYQNQIVWDSTLSLLPHCKPPDDEDVRDIGVSVTCPDENQFQNQTRDADVMA